MPSSGVTKPERGGTSFDGEEPTELMAVPRAPQKTIEMRVEPPPEDEDGPLRKYLAPRLLPTQTVPEAAPAGDKIVINVKPVAEGAAAAEPKLDAERARRRAPTVRIERGTLAAQGMLPTRSPALDDGIDVSFGEAEGEVAGPSVRAIERPDPNTGSTNWKLLLGGVALLLAVVGAVGAVLGFTDTIELPGMARAPEPTSEPKVATTTAAPTASPTVTAQTSAPPAATTVETAAPSAASAVAPRSAAPTPARPPFQPKPRYTPPPPRTNGRINPTTI